MPPKQSFILTALLLLAFAMPATAQVSLLQNTSVFETRRALIAAPAQPLTQATFPNAGSLFRDKAATSMFAPLPPKPEKPAKTRTPPLRNATQIDRVRALIGRAEAGRLGYDAVQYRATIKPVKPPTQMTIQQIYDWIAATPGQQHAIGRYQFIPATLKRLVKRQGVSVNALFSEQVQDSLANLLLEEAGLLAFTTGKMSREDYMHNLAKIWAGLPTSSGASYYAGYAGNKATMTWAYFDAEMAKIFPS